MISSPIFVFGMIRSGTTLLSKILSTHPQIEIASDPYMQFFKYFRNELYLNNGFKNFDQNSPISDNFWNANEDINEDINKSTLNIPIINVSLHHIIKSISKYCVRDSPKINSYLPTIKSDNFQKLFEDLLELVKTAYGNDNTKYYGFKTTFCEQFIKPIINTYHNSKCICIVRDPRAVYASHINEHDKHYPILFLIRNWRKSIYYFLENKVNTNNLLIIKYEDLVSDSEKIIHNLCDFLGVKYNDKMTNANNFKDGQGEMWRQNSSFGAKDTISNSNINKWENVLDKKAIQFIEDLCECELKFFEYNRYTNQNIFNTCSEPFIENLSDIYEWLGPYMSQYVANEKELNKEMIRFLFAGNNKYYLTHKEYQKHLLLSDKLM